MSAEPVTTATGIPSRPELGKELARVLGAQVDVEQDDGRAVPLDRCLRLGERRGFADREPLELEVDADEDADRRVVVDDERAKTPFHRADAND